MFADDGTDTDGDDDQQSDPGAELSTQIAWGTGTLADSPSDTDSDSSTDTSDPGAELSTQIAWDTGTLADSPSDTDSDNSTDIGDPDAELTTEIDWGAGTLADSPSYTDGDTDDSPARNTWDHRLAEPRSRERPFVRHDTDSHGDGDQPSDPGPALHPESPVAPAPFDSSSDRHRWLDRPERSGDAELSTDIAWVPNSPPTRLAQPTATTTDDSPRSRHLGPSTG